MIRFLYNLLFPFALLFFLPGYVVKMLRRGNYREKFGQRLGFYDAATRAASCVNDRRWRPKVAPFSVAIARARSSTAPRDALRRRTSVPAGN